MINIHKIFPICLTLLIFSFFALAEAPADDLVRQAMTGVSLPVGGLTPELSDSVLENTDFSQPGNVLHCLDEQLSNEFKNCLENQYSDTVEN